MRGRVWWRHHHDIIVLVFFEILAKSTDGWKSISYSFYFLGCCNVCDFSFCFIFLSSLSYTNKSYYTAITTLLHYYHIAHLIHFVKFRIHKFVRLIHFRENVDMISLRFVIDDYWLPLLSSFKLDQSSFWATSKVDQKDIEIWLYMIIYN